MRDHFRRIFHRVDALRRQRGMALMAVHVTAHALLALVRGGDAHLGRLADDAALGHDRQLLQPLKRAAHAEATDLFIIGEQQIDRCLELGLGEAFDPSEHDGNEALHVAGAAAIEQPVALGQFPGVGRPILPIDRHHVGMAGQADAGAILRSDGGIEIGLLGRSVRHQFAGDAEAIQVVAHEVDELEIRVPAGGIKGDQRRSISMLRG